MTLVDLPIVLPPDFDQDEYDRDTCEILAQLQADHEREMTPEELAARRIPLNPVIVVECDRWHPTDVLRSPWALAVRPLLAMAFVRLVGGA